MNKKRRKKKKPATRNKTTSQTCIVTAETGRIKTLAEVQRKSNGATQAQNKRQIQSRSDRTRIGGRRKDERPCDEKRTARRGRRNGGGAKPSKKKKRGGEGGKETKRKKLKKERGKKKKQLVRERIHYHPVTLRPLPACQQQPTGLQQRRAVQTHCARRRHGPDPLAAAAPR